MAQKFKLDYSPEYDFTLLGLVSFEKDYRLGWELNEKLQMDFIRVGDHPLKHPKKGHDQQFSCFLYDDNEACVYYKLLSNRSDGGFLLEDLKNIDYFIVISGECDEFCASEFRRKLTTLESVQSCFILDPETIKGIERVM